MTSKEIGDQKYSLKEEVKRWSNSNSSYIADRIVDGMSLWKTVGKFITKLNLYLRYDPAIPPLGIFPLGNENLGSHKKLYTNI